MRMTLRYHREDDRLEALAGTVQPEELDWIEVRSDLRLGIDRLRQQVAGIRVDHARHFVDYHPIWRFFDDEGVRQLADFQSTVVGDSHAEKRTVELPLPRRHQREVRELLNSRLAV